MSTILNSLQKLASSVENLEASIDLIKASAHAHQSQGAQPDMFGTETRDAVAERLDQTIKQVEIVLGDA